MTKKSILISAHHHKELKKLSEAYNLSFYKLVEEMIIYFKKTGINPTDPKNENPSKGLRELDKRLVSFLKVQERDILKPLRQEVYNYSKELSEENEETRQLLIKVLNDFNQYEINRASKVLNEVQTQRKAILTLAQLMDSKNKAGWVAKIKETFE